MSFAKFSDDCPGCRPVMLKNGKLLPDDSPEMKAVMVAWQATTLEEREAFHEFTCRNSRDLRVMELVLKLSRQMADAIEGGQQ